MTRQYSTVPLASLVQPKVSSPSFWQSGDARLHRAALLGRILRVFTLDSVVVKELNITNYKK